MEREPGPLLASGRAADVFDQGDGTVLRRYRSSHDSEPEARIMTWLGERGLRVPAVVAADGRDIVMERIEGDTMLADLERRPWRLFSHARLLARLQQSVNALAAPAWLPRNTGVPVGSAVLHLDLHPMNVLLSPDGPVLIDWTNVSAGSPTFDASLSVVLMSTFEVTGLRDRVGQRALVGAFSRARGRAAVSATLSAAIEFRLADANLTPGERARLEHLRDRSH